MIAILAIAAAAFEAWAPSGRAAEELDGKAKSAGEASFAGQVIDVQTKKPIAGASVVVDRVLPGVDHGTWPPWARASTYTTDKEGRFRIIFPPEQSAEDRLALSIRVEHPDYIARKTGQTTPLVQLLNSLQSGESTLLEKITLEQGVEYSGQFVTPAGKPVAGVSFDLNHMSPAGNQSQYFLDDGTGVTDQEGRFRRRLPKTQTLLLYLTPPDHAPFQRYFGPDDPGAPAGGSVPTDLGTLVVDRGIRLTGQLLDVQGRPLANQEITAHALYGRHERTTTTDASGRFAFAPLRQGNYAIVGAGQGYQGGFRQDEPKRTSLGTVIKPAKVHLQDGIVPDPVVLHELPTVAVEARFIDSKGRPARGNVVFIGGQMAGAVRPQRRRVVQSIFDGQGFAATVNGVEHEDTSTQIFNWNARLIPDGQGRVKFRVPKDLNNAQIYTSTQNATFAIRLRLGPDKPLLLWSAGQLLELDHDVKDATFTVLRSPRPIITVKTEEGSEPLFDVNVTATAHTPENGDYQINLGKSPDGKFRAEGLLPDQDYFLAAWSPGMIPSCAVRMNLHEGASAEFTLLIRRQPRRPMNGDLAPPFFFKTLDGQSVSLDDFRGKFVVLHFWHPNANNCLEEIPRLKAILKRFGPAGRLAIVGFCLDRDHSQLEKLVKGRELSWPQVMVEDGWSDALMLEYQAGIPESVLVGPDGRVVARSLQGDKIEEVVVKALERD